MALTVSADVSKGLRYMVKNALRERQDAASQRIVHFGNLRYAAAMKRILVSLLLLLAATMPVRAGDKAWVALSPIPYGFVVPKEIASHLSTGPLTGSWAGQVQAAGARAATVVYYQPDVGEKTILFSAYYFPADKWDAAQKPDEPPPFGEAVFRGDGRVLSVAGPHDVMFDPETPDGKNVIKASEYLQNPASFQPVE
jgi:hypothetical protein